MNKLLVNYRHWFLGITLVITALCGLLMLRVNINSDMTLYLPDDSRMKAGIEMIKEEFGMGTDMAGAGVRVMTLDQTDAEKSDMRYSLLQLPEVSNVSIQENGSHTLYELETPSNTDLIALRKTIQNGYEKLEAVETSQDGSTADAGMLLGAVSLLLLVLAAMCSSWLEPVLFLISTGIAVLINNGTNALLPSVSVTTNSITAILQLVLSMDYSIILLNRYRQERALVDNSAIAMQQAIAKAAPSILSSALTTIVGLMMLVFMKLKIGADLGIVLSKGVLCSLVCNFTVLPSLILLFEKGIERTMKRVLVPPTDKLAQFSIRYRIPLAIGFVALLGGSYYLHNLTPITFLNAQESKIDDLFPKKNAILAIYDNDDEHAIMEVIDSMAQDSAVEMTLSYPTLLLREYTADQMVVALQEMNEMNKLQSEEPQSLPFELLSEDLLKVLYYAARGNRVSSLSFNHLANFLLAQSHDPKPFITTQLSPDMKQKLALLEDFRNMDDMVQESRDKDSLEERMPEVAVQKEVVAEPAVSEEEPMAEVQEPIETETIPYSPFRDTSLIRKQMTSDELAKFMGMNANEARMVFRLAKSPTNKLSPLEFVHFLTGDILKRKVLASMIDEKQRRQLIALQATMDSANTAVATAPSKSPNETTSPTVQTEKMPVETPVAELHTPTADIVATSDTLFAESNPLELLDEMLSGNNRYTAAEMARNFSAMGEYVDPAMMELLYLYYGSCKHYNEAWTLSLDGMISYLSDTLLNDPRFAKIIPADIKDKFPEIRSMMAEKMGMLRAKEHSLAIFVTNFAPESDETYDFIEKLNSQCQEKLKHEPYLVGESVMLSEMKSGFRGEMMLVTLLTIAAIFLIVALSFRSAVTALLLVATVMTGVFVDIAVSAIGGGNILYMAYLVVQSILMGAAIDYGILFANYYRECRAESDLASSLKQAYKGAIHTILTSGLILILVPGAMALLVADATVASIVRAISIGALATVLLVLFVLPGLLVTCDKIIIRKPKTNNTSPSH